MSALLVDRLASALEEVMPVRKEEDGALTVQHDGTFASLRVVTVGDDLELIALSQILVWDVKPDRRFRKQVATSARNMALGTLTMLDKKDHSDVMLRYNFPGNGLSEDGLRMLILMVLSAGVDVRQALLG
jgi:hypothetical protein